MSIFALKNSFREFLYKKSKVVVKNGKGDSPKVCSFVNKTLIFNFWRIFENDVKKKSFLL